jgi:putative SOS response-associated peptidase YedK
MSAWNGPDWIPPHDGWYKVRRDGEEKVRAYGNGHWWIPLPDGWMSADGVYEWQQPRIAPMDVGDESPLDECKRVTLTVTDAQP